MSDDFDITQIIWGLTMNKFHKCGKWYEKRGLLKYTTLIPKKLCALGYRVMYIRDCQRCGKRQFQAIGHCGDGRWMDIKDLWNTLELEEMKNSFEYPGHDVDGAMMAANAVGWGLSEEYSR